MKGLGDINLEPYPGNFVHGIDLSNGYPCWNLSLSGKLFSPDFLAVVDAGVYECHKSIRETELDLIEKGLMPHGAYTPRGIWFIQAAHQIQLGEHKKWSSRSGAHFSEKEVDSISKMGKIELAFEKRRRDIAPQAVSRLSCLYVADDNDEGRAHLRRMLGAEIHIIKITIPLAIRVSKCDTRWFDDYWREPKQEYIDKYWSGECKYEKRSTWEYLVDGMIEANDPEGMEYLLNHGVKFAPKNP